MLSLLCGLNKISDGEIIINDKNINSQNISSFINSKIYYEQEIENIINKLPKTYRDKVERYCYNGNIEQALNVLGDCQLIIGGRFHANILGLVLGKSILPVLYSDKTLHVLQDMEINVPIIDIRKLDEFDVKSLTDEQLNTHFDVEKQKKDAQRHFEKLDILLGGKEDE